MKKNNDNLQHYGANFSGGVGSMEPSFKLGQGGLLN